MTPAGESGSEITVCNLTSRRIAIANRETPESALLLPPFGERVVTPTQAEGYDLGPWESQQLIRVGRCDADADQAPPRTSLLCFVSGYSLMVTLVLGLWSLLSWSPAWGLATLAGVLVTLGCARRAGWHADAWSRMIRAFNMFLGLLFTFGFQAAAIGLMAPSVEDIGAGPETLALVILWLFGGMASVLPAALFLFFHRQKVPTLRANFLRDVVRLDPNVQTIVDAETSYDGLLEDVFGTGTSGAAANGRLPILAATGVISGLWIWTLIPGLQDARSMRDVLVPEPDVVTFAFLGAYVFAINMLFRRYTRSDLGPKAYTHIMIRLFAAIATTWVLSFAPFARTDGEPVALMLLLAFFVGIVPETGTAVVQDLLQQWKPARGAIPSLREDHPLARLDGMSLYDRAHLLEAGIENVESLAHHNLVDLMLWTRIPTARLVDFVDQAVLYLHLRGPTKATRVNGAPDEARTLLARHGIRTATDLERAHAMAASRSKEEGDRLLGLLDSPGLAVCRLRVVMDAMEDDEWMVYVRNWRDQTSMGPPVRSVEEFVRISAEGTRRAQPAKPPALIDLEPAETSPAPSRSPVSLAG